MRPEERAELVSRLVWVALALFLAFFAYGEVHELGRTVRRTELGNQSQQRLITLLEDECNRAKDNKRRADEATERFAALLDEIPSKKDSPALLRAIERYADTASVTINEILFKETTGRELESLSTLQVTVHGTGSYEGLRTFIALCEAAVDEERMGLTFSLRRADLVPAPPHIQGSFVFHVMVRAR